MGVVFLAEDLRLFRQLALKVMLPKYAAKTQAKARVKVAEQPVKARARAPRTKTAAKRGSKAKSTSAAASADKVPGARKCRLPEFVPPCSKEVVDKYNRMWTALKK